MKLFDLLLKKGGHFERENVQKISFSSDNKPVIKTDSKFFSFDKAVIAYEPIWAIGTGKTATPDKAQEVHRIIREYIADQDKEVAAAIKILYGGSVKSGNARELFVQADIDGGLVGGASLEAAEFISICKSADLELCKH